MFLCALTLVLPVAGNLQAAPITFDFSGGGPNATKLVFTQAGIKLTVKARDLTNDVAATVTHNSNGLGVRVQGDGEGALDSIGPNEELVFKITGLPIGVQALRLDQVLFAGLNINQGEDFSLRIDGANPLGNQFTPSSNPWNVGDDILDVGDRTAYANVKFRVNNKGGEEAFRISSLTFSPFASVPEPSTILLIGSGLFSLVGFTKKLKS